jgi:hypothetical protein
MGLFDWWDYLIEKYQSSSKVDGTMGLIDFSNVFFLPDE